MRPCHAKELFSRREPQKVGSELNLEETIYKLSCLPLSVTPWQQRNGLRAASTGNKFPCLITNFVHWRYPDGSISMSKTENGATLPLLLAVTHTKIITFQNNRCGLRTPKSTEVLLVLMLVGCDPNNRLPDGNSCRGIEGIHLRG